MSEDSQQEPKIIIDEDWKEQVQREKEMAAKGNAEDSATLKADVADESKPSSNAGDVAAKDIAAEDFAEEDYSQNLPPATFDFLVTMLATQAMVAMGQIPGASGKPEKVQKPLAKHYIDLLGTLEEKTRGNLEANEQKMLGGILHELRMTFLRV